MKKSKQRVSVILNSDVDGLGFAGENLVVKPGFARNFLLRNGRADLATPEKLKKREAEIRQAEARRADELAAREKLAEQVAAEPVKVTLKVGPNKRIFGSLTAAEVVKQLASRKIDVAAGKLTGLPLKALGSHIVSVKLGLGVTASLPVEITGEKAAAEKPEVAAAK